MSRTATATPPPAYFPPRNATPTMRHCSAPNVNAVHFGPRHAHQPHHPKKKARNVSSAFVGALSPKKMPMEVETVTPAEEALAMSFEEISPLEFGAVSSEGLARSRSSASAASAASASTSTSRTSRSSGKSAASGAEQDEDGDQIMGRATPAPSMSTSSSGSLTSTELPTPSSSRSSSLHQSEPTEIVLEAELIPRSHAPTLAPTPISAKPSWVPYFGKMAKAVVNNGFMSFAEKKKKDSSAASSAASPSPSHASSPSSPKREAVFVPTGPTPCPTVEELAALSEEAAMERRREWALEQQKRVTECARLCSQWPQSGYNQSKWGPNGSRTFYEPQSYANPHYVASLMTKQADLERQMHQQAALYYTCRGYRSSSEGSSMTESESSLASFESAQTSPSSPAASLSLSADLSAAMASPLITAKQANASQVSLLRPPSPLSSSPSSPSKGTQSLSELDTFSKVSLDSSMELDTPITARPNRPSPAVRPARAQSCGAKRPLTTGAYEEEKRRRVDEAAVVSEAVDSGVIMPAQPTLKPPSAVGSKQLSASVPDLSAAKSSQSVAVFGHMVKTSDTHPIIISPFFPNELIPKIAESITLPSAVDQLSSAFMLGSKIDVPSLLLSCAPPSRPDSGVIVPSFASANDGDETGDEIRLGNLLLSSCPGKRLRMEGPVKGRGPVCRDLATDLRRIKNEGVGCLVCCLDDPELALLGVPWSTYRSVALEIGLDVIRVPMPDGFTPVSLNLFDEQVSIIVKDYSLKGINVLVHCRGGVGRAGLTASAWAIKMGFVPPHPSLVLVEEAAHRRAQQDQSHLPSPGPTLPSSSTPNPRSPPSPSSPSTPSSTSPSSTSPSPIPAELEHQIVMSIVERVIAMIRSRRGLKAIESFEQVQFLASYVRWIRAQQVGAARAVEGKDRIAGGA